MSETAVSTNHQRNQNLDRRDQDLLRAKNAKLVVVFDLATPTSFTDSEDCSVRGIVKQVDKHSIEIEIHGTERRVWISKAMIVGTEVL